MGCAVASLNNNVRPITMRVLRYILGSIGLVGLALWLQLIALAALFWGFKAGGMQGGPSVAQRWFCALIPAVAFVYYFCIAAYEWSRRMLLIGIAVHLALLASVFTLVSVTDGGFIIAPGLLFGGILWIVYVLFTKQNDNAAEQIAPHEPPLPVLSSSSPIPQTLDSRPKPASSGGR